MYSPLLLVGFCVLQVQPTAVYPGGQMADEAATLHPGFTYVLFLHTTVDLQVCADLVLQTSGLPVTAAQYAAFSGLLQGHLGEPHQVP